MPTKTINVSSLTAFNIFRLDEELVHMKENYKEMVNEVWRKLGNKKTYNCSYTFPTIKISYILKIAWDD